MDKIKDILQDVFKEMNVKPQEEVNVESVLDNILTAKEKEHACLFGLKEDTITVIVDSSVWLYHLKMKKKKILNGVQQNMPEIKDIKLKIGKVK